MIPTSLTSLFRCVRCALCTYNVNNMCVMCGGTPLIQAPIGQKRVSVLVMCPHCKKLLLGRERKGVLILSGVSLAVPRMRSSPRVCTLISPATMEGVFLPHKTRLYSIPAWGSSLLPTHFVHLYLTIISVIDPRSKACSYVVTRHRSRVLIILTMMARVISTGEFGSKWSIL